MRLKLAFFCAEELILAFSLCAQRLRLRRPAAAAVCCRASAEWLLRVRRLSRTFSLVLLWGVRHIPKARCAVHEQVHCCLLLGYMCCTCSSATVAAHNFTGMCYRGLRMFVTLRGRQGARNWQLLQGAVARVSRAALQ